MKEVLTRESEHASGFLVDAGDAGAPLKVFGKKDAEVGFCWTSWRIVLLREYKKKDLDLMLKMSHFLFLKCVTQVSAHVSIQY